MRSESIGTNPWQAETRMSEPEPESDEARQRAIIERGEAIAVRWVGEAHAREIVQRIVVAYWKQLLRDRAAAVVQDLDAWLAKAIRRQILNDRKADQRREVRERQAAPGVHHGVQMHMYPGIGLEREELDAVIDQTLAAMPSQRREDWKQVQAGGDDAVMKVAAARGANADAVRRNVHLATTELLAAARQYLATGTTKFGSSLRRGGGTAEEEA
jgi:hypothetical protein